MKEARLKSPVLTNRLKKEGSEVATNCSRLRLQAIDGKMRLIDVADTKPAIGNYS